MRSRTLLPLLLLSVALAGTPLLLASAQDRPTRVEQEALPDGSHGQVVDRDLPDHVVGWAPRQNVSAYRPHRPPPPPPPPPPPGGFTFEAHEWGVWLLRQGRVAHLGELAAESPPFVLRAPGARLPPPRPPPVVRPIVPPVVHPHPHPIAPPPGWDRPVARKPVIFLRASQPLAVTVEVGFLGGEPWLYYPQARILDHGPNPGSRSILFNGRVEPLSRTLLAAPPAGHWWNDLRAGGGQVFVSDAGSAERFLFYDGPVAFERAFLLSWQGRGAQVTPTGTERTLFLLDSGRYVEHDVEAGRGARFMSEGDMGALRRRLDTMLQGRGLSAAESRSLLETWRDELFRTPSARAIYFVPRDAYDRMLPIRITPAPTELVRVGLVIEDLATGP